MVSRAEVEDYVRQGKTEAEGYTNIQLDLAEAHEIGAAEVDDGSRGGHRCKGGGARD